MSKRLNLTFLDTVFEEFEDWAQQQGSPTANLGSFLIELGTRQDEEKGEIVPSKKKSPVIKGKEEKNEADRE